jgi:outer membrane murein-binding lipoprotein Lpp
LSAAFLAQACGEPESTVEERLRQDLQYQSSRIDDLANKVDTLERAAPYLDDVRKNAEREKAEAERAAARLESLKAGQRQVEQSQKLLCDATQDC